MSILFLLIPLGLALLALAIAAFFWAVRNGQFDDLETPGTLVLFDDEPGLPRARPVHPEARR
jgi:cbb3-type cytochrome oxidase maturation protein